MDLKIRYTLDTVLCRGCKKSYENVPYDRVGQLILDLTYEHKGVNFKISIVPSGDKLCVIAEVY